MEQTLDLASPAFLADVHGSLDRLRSQHFFARAANGDGVFFNQADAAWVMRCVDFRFTFVEIDDQTSPYLAKAIQHELLNMHGEEHSRMRRLVSAGLRDRVEDELKDRIHAIADELIDALPNSGVVDLCRDFAEPLPGRVLGPMYGIPYDEAVDFNAWIRTGGRKLDALQSGEPIGEIEDANRKMHDYLRELLAERRTSLGTDIFSELIQAEVDGDRLTEEELVYLATELASAGVDTTRDQLPLILLSLLTHPEQYDRLAKDPSLALAAVDEGMRYAPLPWVLPHTAVNDVHYKGVDFVEGDTVLILVPATNRDPNVMDEPHRFDIDRPRARNFSFGQGAHACPAAQLARIEMAIAVERLVTRTSLQLAEEPALTTSGKGRIPTSLLAHITKH
ncbi:MAG TPA: cytochrome P450 [Acidimicrobiaceae bacterium]|nr:cytochrome P450 [Acidimicrobiaceae bacterium]